MFINYKTLVKPMNTIYVYKKFKLMNVKPNATERIYFNKIKIYAAVFTKYLCIVREWIIYIYKFN